MSIHNQLHIKRTGKFVVYFDQKVKRKDNCRGGIFSHCIAQPSTSHFITALHGTKQVSIRWLNIKVQTINHCSLLYWEHTKETELMLAQRHLEQNIKNSNIKRQLLAWRHFKCHIRITSEQFLLFLQLCTKG